MAEEKVVLAVSISLVTVVILFITLVIILICRHRKRLKKREITVDSELRKYDRSTSTQHVAIHSIDITVQDTEVTPNQMEYVMSLPPDTTHTGQVNPGLTTDDIEPPIRKSATRYSEIDLNAGY